MLWAQKKTEEKAPVAILEGFCITMRPPQADDWRDWAAVRQTNKAFLEPYEPRWPRDSQSRDFFERRLALQYRNWRNGRSCSFLIFKNKDSRLIGGMNINNICRGAAQYASLGYWIDQTHEGQGYMGEAMRLTIKFCFETLNLHRIHAACLTHNERSKNLLLRAGFKEEGFAEKYLQIDGKWQDHILYGLTQERWQSRAPGIAGEHGGIEA